MRRSKAEIFFHVVWSTWRRQPFVGPDIERGVYRCVEKEAVSLGCRVVAIGGVADHIHLLVQVPTTLCVATLAKQTKGVSSTLVRDELAPDSAFKWQEGYGAFSVSRSHVARVAKYVLRQKEHHAEGRLWREWEETDEEAPVVEDTLP